MADQARELMMVRRDNITGDLLAWEPPKVEVGYPEDVAGRGPLENKIARLIGRALRDTKDSGGKSRSTIAAEMSRELGRQVSEDMLNKWASEASGAHRIPLDAFIALIKASEADDLLGFVPNLFGHVVVPEQYANIIELHLIEEHEEDVAALKARLVSKVRLRR